MAYSDSLLGQGEERLYTTHPSWTVLLHWIGWRVFFAIVLIVVGIFARVKLVTAHASKIRMEFGNGVLIVTLVAAFVLLLIAAAQVLRWRNEIYMVTDRRVIQIYGVLGKKSIDSSLNAINDLILNQTLFGRMFNYGDLEIVTGNDVAADTFTKISDPLAFKRAVLAAKESYLERINSGGYHQTQPMPAAAPVEDVPSLIARLADLRDRGAISQAEYDAKRAELLNRI